MYIFIISSFYLDLIYQQSMARRGFLLVLSNLLNRRTLHQALVPSMPVGIVLLKLQIFIPIYPWDHHIPSNKRQIRNGAAIDITTVPYSFEDVRTTYCRQGTAFPASTCLKHQVHVLPGPCTCFLRWISSQGGISRTMLPVQSMVLDHSFGSGAIA